jgi:hypothetical protein
MVEDLPLIGAEFAIDAGDQLARTGAWLVPLLGRLSRFPPEPPNQLTQPLRRRRALFVTRFPAAGVCQLVGNLREIDLEVVDQDVVHAVVLIDSS